MKNKQGKKNGGKLPCFFYQKNRFYRVNKKTGKLKRIKFSQIEGEKVNTKKGVKIIYKTRKGKIKLSSVYSEKVMERRFEDKIILSKTGRIKLKYYYREYFEIKKIMTIFEGKYLALKLVKVPKKSITLFFLQLKVGKKILPFATKAHSKRTTLVQEIELLFESIIENIFYYGSNLEKAKIIKLSFVSFYKAKRMKYKKPKVTKKKKYKKPEIEEIKRKKYKKPMVKIIKKKYRKPKIRENEVIHIS